MQEFGVLKYSPAPEIVEPRNIALVLPHNRGSRLYYLGSFPRLMCAAPTMKAGALAFVLESVNQDLVSKPVAEAMAYLTRCDRKFSVDGPHLHGALGERLLRALSTTYLAHPRPEQAGAVAKRAFEQRLNHYMYDRLQVPVDLLRLRARPRQFLRDPRAVSLAGSVSWSRVVVTPAGAVTFWPVDLAHAKYADQFLKARHAASVLRKIRDTERRDLTAAVLLFNRDLLVDSKPRSERILFDLEQTRSAVDFTVQPGIDDGPLASKVRDLVASSSLH